MAELADAQDLGSCEEIRVGSTPTTRTRMNDPTQFEQVDETCGLGRVILCLEILGMSVFFEIIMPKRI